MYELFAQVQFSAAHQLVNYAGSCAKWHGHNWVVQAFVQASQLDNVGLGVDLRIIRRALGEIVAPLDHANLNDFTGFEGKNPSCETIAAYVYRELVKRLNTHDVHVDRITVYETPTSGATYSE